MDAYKRTEEILNNNIDKLHTTAQYLMKHEKMNGDVFAKVMDGTYVEEPDAEETEVFETTFNDTDEE